jgi:hypothetical protein
MQLDLEILDTQLQPEEIETIECIAR